MSENAITREQTGATAMAGERIVIRVPNWVGDAVMATPALRSMRLGFPKAEISLHGAKKILELLEGLDSFDEQIPLPPKTGGRRRSLLREASALRRHRFDRGLLLPNSFSSALVFFFGRVRRRTGYAINGRGLWLSRSIPVSAQARKRDPKPMTEYYLDIARFAGGAETNGRCELAATPECEAKAEAFLRRTGLAGARPLVGLNAGAAFGPSKCWTPEGFAAVADRVAAEMGGRTVLLCGTGEEDTARRIVGLAQAPVVETATDVLPLGVLKSVMRRLDLLVTTDTGPRHIAVAFGVPVVVLMGPTNPAYTAANLDRTRVIRLAVDCAPCHKKECDRDHVCMRGISPEMVMEQAAELLAAASAEVK